MHVRNARLKKSFAIASAFGLTVYFLLFVQAFTPIKSAFAYDEADAKTEYMLHTSKNGSVSVSKSSAEAYRTSFSARFFNGGITFPTGESGASAEIFKAAFAEDGSLSTLTIRSRDGVCEYSADGGETWTQGLPAGWEDSELPKAEGFIGESGASAEIFKATFAEDGSLSSLIIRSRDGVCEYSADGGETWTQGLPAGWEDSELPDGKGFRFKGESGVETDGGESWSEEP
ncbi:MAG: exo-alpha-sialidase [Clostridiales bacterium]|nr:exo-alpha-sialidase [Clostridiales bacterium]